MALYSGKDLSVYKLKSGEKSSEFREKREGLEANCLHYDTSRKSVLVGSNKKLTLCRKSEDHHLNFGQQLSISIDDNITCITTK